MTGVKVKAWRRARLKCLNRIIVTKSSHKTDTKLRSRCAFRSMKVHEDEYIVV